MLRYLLALSLLLFLSACSKEVLVVQTPSKAPVELNSTTIANIPIPVREHGYSNFETQVIRTQNEMDGFMESVNQQANWNQKANFLESLSLKPIDFGLYNLLIYRITEASGSTILSVDAPKGDENNITIMIGRDEPSIGTTDMAYYALAYKVAKGVQSVTFDNGVEKKTIENQTITSKQTNTIAVPSQCLEWFDGCNNCGRVSEEGIPVCTEKHCDSYGEFRCTKWKEQPEEQTPEYVPSHHDSEQ